MDSADSGSDRDRTEAKIHVHATQLGGAAEPLVLPLAAVGLEAIASVGGKNASLGEMIRSLAASGVQVPEGFATRAAAYRLFLASNGLEPPLRAILEGLDTADLAGLHTAGQAARALLLAAPLPARLEQEIRIAYRALGAPAVAVRSSATAEDLPNASFAGQQETFLPIEGEADLLEACRRCYASLFTNRALSYRQLNGFDHLEVALSIGIQRMVAADRLSRCSAAHRRLRAWRNGASGSGDSR
jgi:pyruvate,water dikinase